MEAHTPVLTQSVTSPYSSSHLPLRSVAVLGAGTMGSQIAAHAANAGLQVLLLDLPGQGADRNEIVRSGLARAVKLRPDPFFDEAARQRVRVGNFEDDLKQIADADWIIEAVVERADVKRPLLERIASVASDDAIVSTNTSGIPVAELAEGLPASFRRRLLGTHFFNPPRYLRLLEVIPTPDTDPEVVARVARFARLHLGKGIVIANDRPYFIANRIGVYAMLRAMRFFLDGEYTIEEIDAVTGTLIGRPSSATFRTADVVGLDVLMDVLTGMGERLTSDESRDQFQPPPLLQGLVGAGAKGAKVGAGFYRKEDGVIKSIARDGSGYEAHAVDAGFLSEFESIRDLDQRMVALYESDSRAGRLFRESTLDVLAYAARRVPEVTPNPADLDRALRWGFGWEKGPFEIWETLGFDRVRSDMERAGIAVPEWVARARDGIYRRRGEHTAVFIPAESGYHEEPFPRDVLNLAAIRSDARSVLWENDEAALLDAGQCVALFEFRSKGNSLSRAVMQGLMKAIDQVERDPDLRGMIIGNDGKNFSVGANLAEMAQAAQDRRFDAIDAYLKEFQGAIQRVHYAAKPVVVAVHQRVLGGACELLMASDAPVASAETYVGLVEVGVGLIPAGTGVMRLARRAAQESRTGFPSHLQPHVQRYFEQVLRATVSGSAAEAVTLGYLPEHAHIVMHDDRRLFAAREQVVRLAEMGYRPRPIGGPIRVLGRQGWAALVVLVDQYRQGGFITEYDAVIANRLAYAFTGGDLVGVQDVDESYLLDLEREVFLQLLGEERTQQRVAHMLQHKKPLRN